MWIKSGKSVDGDINDRKNFYCPKINKMSKLLSKILGAKKFKLDRWASDFEMEFSRKGNFANVFLEINLKGSLKILLIYARENDYFEVGLDHQEGDPWLTTDFYKMKKETFSQLEKNFWSIFESYYILETRGSKDSYLHVLDENMKFKYSINCTNFPGLHFGKREFRLYLPIINQLKK